jgi:peroxiredoxin
MHPIKPLMPRQPVPSLEVPTIGGGRWSLAEQRPANFTLLVFYRGRHCPVCAKYLRELSATLGAFAERGVEAIALSSDGQERAEQAKADWKLGELTVGYDLPLDKAREWGLYLSSGRGKTSIGIEEPPVFSEPAVYLVRPDGTLYYGAVQTMPFARPHFDELLTAVDFALNKDYPARGEVVDHRALAGR